jgi:crossover junction endodeoxyribonuclease RuvC
MIVIGIDPGLSATGYGIIESNGFNKYTCGAFGSIKTSSKIDIPTRLFIIFSNLVNIIESYMPTCAGIETVFVGKDPKNHLHMGEVRGVIFLALKMKNIATHEFSPLQVKKSITGYGGAQKSQVAFMVTKLLNITTAIDEHAADALAIAMAALNQHNLEERCGYHDRITPR